MTDKDLLSALADLQGEAYLQKLPYAAGLVQKLRHRFSELKAENAKLQSLKHLLDLIESETK